MSELKVGDRVKPVRDLVWILDRLGWIVAFEVVGAIEGARVHWDGLPPDTSQWVALWKLEAVGVIDMLGGLDAEG